MTTYEIYKLLKKIDKTWKRSWRAPIFRREVLGKIAKVMDKTSCWYWIDQPLDVSQYYVRIKTKKTGKTGAKRKNIPKLVYKIVFKEKVKGKVVFSCGDTRCLRPGHMRSVPEHINTIKDFFHLGRIKIMLDRTSCWETRLHTNADGYARSNFQKKYGPAHRLSWEICRNEKMPKELYACHRCDNPKCWRPGHIFAGTPQENIIDCTRKGRNIGAFKPGIENFNPARRLTIPEVRMIRSLYHRGKNPCGIAYRFGITCEYVKGIAKRKRWPWLKSTGTAN